MNTTTTVDFNQNLFDFKMLTEEALFRSLRFHRGMASLISQELNQRSLQQCNNPNKTPEILK
jgi:hypothetical protein